ncbi:LysE family translocator [Thauera chlorobenzoica]|uniref:LysE family translocator n=1 Tax=Thauera chlorobenzoica TaxID=96773 RepID=UPI0018DE6794|nr:LysE family translocator [Thauera chlorobenzoica]
MILIPGPTVLLVTGHALSAGLRNALFSILGVCLGDIVAMSLTFLGLGAVLATSAEWFLVLKWLGAAYLIYLGITLWRAPVPPEAGTGNQETRPARIILRAFTVNVLHPKGLAFYAAFLPQFIRPADPALPQMLLLGTTFTAIAFSVLLGYAITAARFRSRLARPDVRRFCNRSGAGCLVGAGMYTLSMQRSG